MTGALERVLYIAGASRSGSTALCYLLQQHSEIAALSQVEWLAEYAADSDEPCSCGRAVEACPFWRQVARNFAQLRGASPDYRFADADVRTAGSWELPAWNTALLHGLSALGSRWALQAAARQVQSLAWNQRGAEQTLLLFEAVRGAAARRVVVDASKNALRAKTLYLADPARVRIVWLVRDGRAVAHGRSRRMRHSMRRAALSWLRANLEVAAALASIPREHWLLLRYEDVCAAPQSALDRVFSLLSLSPQPVSRSLDKGSGHLVGGNEMRYRRAENELLLDARWQREVDERALRAFESVAGWLNRRLGYGAVGAEPRR